jgi:hypothetical protein
MLLFRKKGCLLKLYMPRNFSVCMRYFVTVQCCAVSTNLKMNCPDQHIFITKQAVKCCHCLTCTRQLKYITRCTIATFKLVYETNVFNDKLHFSLVRIKLILVSFPICDTHTQSHGLLIN